jgi:hypothetical protein
MTKLLGHVWPLQRSRFSSVQINVAQHISGIGVPVLTLCICEGRKDIEKDSDMSFSWPFGCMV